MATWSGEETHKLIEIWGEDNIQAMLEGSRRNKEVYARDMKAAGFNKTTEQCQTKIKKLRYKYKKIKDKHGKTGEDRKDWKFLEAMDAVLGHKPATKPPVVMESSIDMIEQQQLDPCIEDTVSETQSRCTSYDSEAGESSRSCSETPLTEEKMPKSRKRKKVHNNSADKVEALVEKMINVQEESDRHYMKLEEKILEMEDKRQKVANNFSYN